MIIDPDLELVDEWSAKVGANISGSPKFVVPTSYGTNNLAIGREFFTKGPANADWLASLHRSIPLNTGKLALLFELMTDTNAPNVAQALEFDTRVSIAGYNYNFSSQFNYNKSGMWQISDAKGVWTDTIFRPGIFIPNVFVSVRFDYQFDTSKHTYSFISASVGLQKFMVPANLQNLAAPNLGWKDFCGMQVQLDLNSKGGSFSEYLRNVRYVWS